MRTMTDSKATSRMQVAIFDFDGTLVDSLEQTIEAYNRLAPRFRVKPIVREQLPRLRTLGARAAMREHDVSLWKLPWIVRSMRRALREKVDGLQAIPEVPEALRALAANGCRMSILSSNATQTIERFLERNQLQLFEQVSGGSSMLGKQRALERLCKRMGLSPSAAVYVGDEARDIEAAHAAGIRSIAVSWGYADRGALVARNPTYVIDRPGELLELLSAP
jgi:phosphoglycolate phosphatase